MYAALQHAAPNAPDVGQVPCFYSGEGRPHPERAKRTGEEGGAGRRCENKKFLGDQLLRPRKQATAMKTPSKYLVSPYKLDNFLRLTPSETINFSRLVNVSWTTSSRLAKMRWTTFFAQTDNFLHPLPHTTTESRRWGGPSRPPRRRSRGGREGNKGEFLRLVFVDRPRASRLDLFSRRGRRISFALPAFRGGPLPSRPKPRLTGCRGERWRAQSGEARSASGWSPSP